MNVILHLPNNDKDRNLLEKRIAEIHCEAIESYLKRSSYTIEDKIKLIDGIEKKVCCHGFDAVQRDARHGMNSNL